MPQDVHCIIGASGQLGTELAVALHNAGERVVLLDIKAPPSLLCLDCPLKKWMSATKLPFLPRFVRTHRVTHVYHLAAALSARGEQDPQWAWDLNMKGLLHVLDLAAGMDGHRVRSFGPAPLPCLAQALAPWPRSRHTGCPARSMASAKMWASIGALGTTNTEASM